MNFKGEKRTNDTHESKTDQEARLARKGNGREARLSHMGHVLVENRNGLVVDAEVTSATGTAERDAALAMLKRERDRREKRSKKQPKSSRRKNRKGRRLTIAADKGYDTRDFVRRCRELRFTPHVAKFEHARRRSSIDGRTTHHAGYRRSTKARLLTEKTFGWLKTFGSLRRSRFRGRAKTEQSFLLGFAALHLLRMAKMAR